MTRDLMEKERLEARWKVLIADDEPIIREGIRSAVDWHALGMEIAAEAEDGEEALELALQHQVDVMLVDLNMPIMDGITLMKHVRKQLPSCRLIIITGHDEFQYAQEAIRLNVDEYLLKPANPEQLQKVLHDVKMSLENDRREREHLLMASRQIERSYPLLRERFCLEWIEGRMSDGEVLEQLEFLQLPPACPDWLGVIRWSDPAVERTLIRERDRQLYAFAVENIVKEWLEDRQHVLFRDGGGLIAVMIWGSCSEELLSKIAESIMRYLKLSVSHVFKPLAGRLSDIPQTYREARQAVYRRASLSPVVQRARLRISEGYTERGLTLEQIAEELNVNPVYLSRMLKQELGVTFSQLVTELRMKRAVELLNTTDLTIMEIAEQLGYETQHYFSTVFKKTVGISPNRYRRGELVQAYGAETAGESKD